VFPDANGNLNPPSAANPIPTTPTNSGDVGTDASANAPALSGLNLLGTLAVNASRLGYIVQVQDTSSDCGGTGGNAGGLVVVLDDGTGANLTVLVVSYAATKGAQGGALSWAGMPHTGRIRYYGTAGCQVGAHQW